MRAIAEFAMRGRGHAIGTSVLSACFPLLNWLSAAIVGLVVLRKGGVEGAMVLLWTLLPLGAALYLFGNPTPVIFLFGTALLALVLRETVSWELTLAAAVGFSAIGSLVFEYTAAEVLVLIVEMYVDYLRQIPVEITYEAARKAIIGFFAMGQAYAMLALLVLARWWQSQLYNPGGFRQEFHQLRMSPLMSSGYLVVLVVCFVFSNLLGRWVPLLTVPLMFCGLALIHWGFGYRSVSANWVFAFYLLLVLFFQFIYPLVAALALMDSYLDLRKRIEV